MADNKIIVPITKGAAKVPVIMQMEALECGAAALAVRGNYAMSVELMCRDAFEGDPRELLAGFLSGIHYNDREAQ